MPRTKLEKKYDERNTNIVMAIGTLQEECQAFFEMIQLLGNQCAWTDRKVETIIEAAHKLKQVYEEELI